MRFASICALCATLLWSVWCPAGTEAGAAPIVVGSRFVYAVRKGDSLTAIGSRLGISEKVLARDNGLRPPYLLKIGERLNVDNRHLVPDILTEGVVINIPQRMLFLFLNGEVAAAYPVGLGRPDWKTPTGDFTIVHKEKNKTWCVPKSIQEEMRKAGKPVLTRVPPGPNNPLGGYWMELSEPAYGIHATIAPASVYRMRTHGCIRLHPDDAAALYEKVYPGMPVKIIYAPVLLATLEDGQVLVEVNPDVYNRGADPLQTLRDAARTRGMEEKIDWAVVGELVRAKEGLARDAGRMR